MQLRAMNGHVDVRGYPDTPLPYGTIRINGSALGGLLFSMDTPVTSALSQFDATMNRNVQAVTRGLYILARPCAMGTDV